MLKEKKKELAWTPKNFSSTAKQNIDTIVSESKEFRDALDILDSEVHSYVENPPREVVLSWARRSSGLGNQMRKIYRKLEASLRNAEAARYMEIKLECDSNPDMKFTDGSAKMDAQSYCRSLRMARSLFQGYVESADNIISICRMHTSQQGLDQSNDISV